jgi:hypothetical protein
VMVFYIIYFLPFPVVPNSCSFVVGFKEEPDRASLVFVAQSLLDEKCVPSFNLQRRQENGRAAYAQHRQRCDH